MVSGDGLMPRYDYLCECGRVHLDVTLTNWADVSGHHETCSHCGQEMKKMPAAPNFNVTGFNAKNHYGAKHE